MFSHLSIQMANLRLYNNITQKEFSKMTKLSTNTIRAFENGTSKRAIKYIHIYLKQFNQFIINYVDFTKIIFTNINEKINFLKLFYGASTNIELDNILNKPSGYISDSLTKKSYRDFNYVIDREIEIVLDFVNKKRK